MRIGSYFEFVRTNWMRLLLTDLAEQVVFSKSRNLKWNTWFTENGPDIFEVPALIIELKTFLEDQENCRFYRIRSCVNFLTTDLIDAVENKGGIVSSRELADSIASTNLGVQIKKTAKAYKLELPTCQAKLVFWPRALILKNLTAAESKQAKQLFSALHVYPLLLEIDLTEVAKKGLAEEFGKIVRTYH